MYRIPIHLVKKTEYSGAGNDDVFLDSPLLFLLLLLTEEEATEETSSSSSSSAAAAAAAAASAPLLSLLLLLLLPLVDSLLISEVRVRVHTSNSATVSA